ncbi:hypothetical protein ACJX0J_028318, partial [Zea mays]
VDGFDVYEEGVYFTGNQHDIQLMRFAFVDVNASQLAWAKDIFMHVILFSDCYYLINNRSLEVQLYNI